MSSGSSRSRSASTGFQCSVCSQPRPHGKCHNSDSDDHEHELHPVMFSWYGSSSQQKNDKDKTDKADNHLSLPLHSITSATGTGVGIAYPSDAKRLSGASGSRLRLPGSENGTPIGGRSARSSSEREGGITSPPRNSTSARHTQEPEEDFDGLFDLGAPNPHDERVLELRADVAAMRKDRPAFLKAIDPDLEEDRGRPSRNRPPDNFYDPFTGEFVAKLQAPGNFGTPRDRSRERDDSLSTNRDRGNLDAFQTTPAIWSQLAKIRDLQSEISAMHVQMEGVSVTNHPHGRQYHRRNLSTVDLGLELSMMEELNGESDDRPQSNVDPGLEVDFDRLDAKFKGREEQIDRIMNKLDDLSQALGEFHQIDMPIFESSLGLARSPPGPGLAGSPLSHSPPAKSPLSNAWRQPKPFSTASTGSSNPNSPIGGGPTLRSTQTSNLNPLTAPNVTGLSAAAAADEDLPPIVIPVPTTFERPAAALASKAPHGPMPPLMETISSKPLSDSPQNISKPLPDVERPSTL